MRLARTPRPARPNPRRAIPSQAVRNLRGPRPPTAMEAVLHRALEAEWRAAGLTTDALPELGHGWWRALRQVAARLVPWVRRGVQGALRGRPLPASKPTPASWAERVTQAVQTAKSLTGAAAAASLELFIEHTRQIRELARAAGAAAYIWTTMRDQKVRPLHQLLEGTKQRWDDPPLAGLPDFHGHPGEAAGPCRCVPYPWVL